MHIGKYDLNDNEEEWTKEWVKKTLAKCASDLTAALNKQIESDDVGKLLCSGREERVEQEEKKDKKKRNKKGWK